MKKDGGSPVLLKKKRDCYESVVVCTEIIKKRRLDYVIILYNIVFI